MFFVRPINPLNIHPKIKVSLFFFCFVAGVSGCVKNKPIDKTVGAVAVQPVIVTVQPVVKVKKIKNPRFIKNEYKKEKVVDAKKYNCGYFHFLWGRHAELAAKYNEALVSYEKSIVCDRKADFILRKIPLLLLRLNREKEAVSKLKEYLRQHPEDHISRMLLAKIFIRQGGFQKAAEQYRKVYTLNPGEMTPLLLLSELYLADNKAYMAKEVLQEVLIVDKQSYSAHLLLARLLIAEEKFEAGQRHYQQALDLTWSEGLNLEIADVFIQRKKYSQAAAMYQDILEHDEANEEARICLMQVYLLQKKEKTALAELNKLEKITKNSELAELIIVKFYIRWEEYNKAIALLEEILQKKEMSEAQYLLGIISFQEKQYKKALDALRRISSEAKEYEDGLFLQVRTLYALQRHKEAAGFLESVIADDKRHSADVYILLAGIYQFEEQDKLCRNTFRRALKAYPENTQLLYEYGLFLDYAGEQRQAITMMRRIISTNPEHAGALNYVGYTWANNKENLNQALRYISRAVELEPDNGYIYDSLGWVCYQQGKFQEAEKELKTAKELSPDDPAVLDHLAAVYLALGRPEEALQTWKKVLKLYRIRSSERRKNGKKMGKKAKLEAQKSRRIQKKISTLAGKENEK